MHNKEKVYKFALKVVVLICFFLKKNKKSFLQKSAYCPYCPKIKKAVH